MNNVHSNCCYATAGENQEAPLVYSRQVWSLAVWSGLRDACTVWNSAGNLAWRSLTKLIKRVWVSVNLEMHKCIRLNCQGCVFTKELKTYDQILKIFIIFKLPTVWVKQTCIYYQNISDLMILYKLYLLKFITCECKDLWFVFLAFFGQC